MIETTGVRYRYPTGTPALDGVSVRIRAGEYVAMMGANGSGKTTLARCLNGLLVPQEGEIRVDGLSTNRAGDIFRLREKVGMVFQNPDDQLVAASVETEIAFGLENLGVPRPQMLTRVDEALAEFRLESIRAYPPHQLSGGEKQRVAVAAAMVLRPAYLVLDEPTALLDPRSRQDVLELLRTLSAEHGIAVIHITQKPEEAACAQRLIIMDAGRIHADGTPASVFNDYHDLQNLGLDVPFPLKLVQALSRGGIDLAGTPSQRLDDTWLLQQLKARLTQPLDPAADRTPQAAPDKMRTEDLGYTYGRGLPTCRTALDGVSVGLPAGSITALLGPSGSGKTTLAQHLNALLKPDRGRVLLDGRDLWCQPLPRIRQRVGLVFQFPEMQLFADTVAADVAYGPRNLGWNEPKVQDAVQRGLSAVGLALDLFGDRSPLALSGGQRRRVALAGILAMDPEVLVLDEPTAGLDPRTAADMTAILANLAGAGKTILLITHDMDQVAALAAWVAVLVNGRMVLEGATRTVLAAPGFQQQSGLELPSVLRFASRLCQQAGIEPTACLTLNELVTAVLRSAGAPSPVMNLQTGRSTCPGQPTVC